jgi:hypothetical protein
LLHFSLAVSGLQAGMIGFITLQQSAPSQMTWSCNLLADCNLDGFELLWQDLEMQDVPAPSVVVTQAPAQVWVLVPWHLHGVYVLQKSLVELFLI